MPVRHLFVEQLKQVCGDMCCLHRVMPFEIDININL